MPGYGEWGQNSTNAVAKTMSLSLNLGFLTRHKTNRLG